MSVQVQDEQGNPPVHPCIVEIFRPYYTWEVSGTPSPGDVTIRRVFQVDSANFPRVEDVMRLVFSSDFAISYTPLGIVNVRLGGLTINITYRDGDTTDHQLQFVNGILTKRI